MSSKRAFSLESGQTGNHSKGVMMLSGATTADAPIGFGGFDNSFGKGDNL